jgi:hypothetical protein
MIDRRAVSLAGGIGLLIAHRPGFGQPGATLRRVRGSVARFGNRRSPNNRRGSEPRRIGVLSLVGTPSASARGLLALRHGLRSGGHVEGRDVLIEGRYAARQDEFPRLAVAGINVLSSPSCMRTAPVSSNLRPQQNCAPSTSDRRAPRKAA